MVDYAGVNDNYQDQYAHKQNGNSTIVLFPFHCMATIATGQCQITVISAGSTTKSLRIWQGNPDLRTMLRRTLSFNRPFDPSYDKPSGTSPSGPLQPPGLTI